MTTWHDRGEENAFLRGGLFWRREWLREQRERKEADKCRSCVGIGRQTSTYSNTLAYKVGLETGLSE